MHIFDIINPLFQYEILNTSVSLFQKSIISNIFMNPFFGLHKDFYCHCYLVVTVLSCICAPVQIILKLIT